MVLSVDGEGEVVLDGGVLVGGPQVAGATGSGRGVSQPDRRREEDDESERSIVAQWLRAHADEVRIVEVESPLGWAIPVRRIPELAELVESVRSAESAEPAESVESADQCGSGVVRDPETGRVSGDRDGSAA